LAVFLRMDKKTVASDLGFTVRRESVYTLSYQEGDRVLRFGLEVSGVPEYDFILFPDGPSSRAWQPPFDQERLSVEKKKEIIDRVVAAVKFMGQNPLLHKKGG
jgi:hypothetical protein